MTLRTAVPEQHSRTEMPLSIELLTARDAYDYEFVAARLHDPDLLLSSVAIRIFRAPLLAVPVGGCRRGGRIDVGPVSAALAVRDVLLGHPVFPLLRVNLTRTTSGESWLVEWGERAPGHPVGAPERLRFYGYTTGRPKMPCPLEQPLSAPYAALADSNDLPEHQRVQDPQDPPPPWPAARQDCPPTPGARPSRPACRPTTVSVRVLPPAGGRPLKSSPTTP